MAMRLRERQVLGSDEDFGPTDERKGEAFWWTKEGQIMRWSVFFGLMFLFLSYMILGYWHAKRRINNGLAPLPYHQWLLSRRDRARYDPAFQTPSVYYNQYPPQQQSEYDRFSMPPPLYTNADLPPTYQPPAGSTKVAPSQWRTDPTRRPAEVVASQPSPPYQAPAGPPPVAVIHTGASAGSNHPNRP
ncbi:hypothetical protein LZ554_008328 [Drepanopeziza brunnea f. sp. 'monogermtubi']|nr:hypothetical protein LZ554_008328 [Drepanopeziza brunnea f. sp. 'monogermtubi']